MKSFVKWAAIALLVVAVLIVAREPLYWQRYIGALLYGGDQLPLSLYTPRVSLRGGDEPPAPRETPASELLDPVALQAAAEYAGKHSSKALIVTRHGYLVFEKYWQGTNFDTPVASQGLGRVVAALAVGAAISQRNIGWPDEPIGFLIPALQRDPRGLITVRNLLQSSSGLGKAPASADAGHVDGSSRVAFTADAIGQYLHLPLAAPPGTRWLDQSADPDLLAFVIQKATGQSYADYVSHTIWRRIGAADATLWLDRPGGAAHADQGFIAHQGDWLRVAELLLRNGNYQGAEVIVPRWVSQLLQPAKSNPDYGAYIRLGTHTAQGMTPYAMNDVFLVEGRGNRLWFVPSMQIAILRTGGPVGSDWDDGRIPNLILRSARDYLPPAARPGGDLRQLVPNH